MINENNSTEKEQNVPVSIKTKKIKTIKPENNDLPKDITPKKKTKKRFKPLLFITIFFLTIFFVFSSQVIVAEQDSNSWFYNLPIIKQIKFLAESADRSLKGEQKDRINVLLLGMGGRNHEGGYLTDTIILASLELTSKKAALISVPRDLAVPVEDMGLQKINSINAYAEMEAVGSGGLAISQAISDILGMPIDYYVRVDFEGFVNIVDELGGVEVEVENTLDDYSYPVAGNEDAEDYSSRYEHLHIEKGKQTMDGTTALKYARSRHALGVEGSDFARAKRQQIIIQAIKDKVISKNMLLKPKTLTNVISEMLEHIDTNIKVWEILKLWDTVKDMDRSQITNKVLDNSPNGLLIDGFSPAGAYILTPRSGDFEEIKYYTNNIFEEPPQEEINEVSKERATIEVRNGTWINGLASQTALDLEKYGFIVVRIGNSSRQNFQKSVIYDLTFGEKTKSLTVLKNRTQANISRTLPEWLVTDIEKELQHEVNPIKPDFILILGQEADSSYSGAENPENEISEQP